LPPGRGRRLVAAFEQLPTSFRRHDAPSSAVTLPTTLAATFVTAFVAAFLAFAAGRAHATAGWHPPSTGSVNLDVFRAALALSVVERLNERYAVTLSKCRIPSTLVVAWQRGEVDEQIFVSAVWLDEAKTFLAIPIADGSLRSSRAWASAAASVAASPATWTTSASATAFDLHVFGARLALLLINLLVEDDPVSGLQDLGAIALVLAGKVREVHEHVLATAVGLDEAEAFLLIISQD